MLLEKFELGPEPILKNVKTLEQKALTRHAQDVTSSREIGKHVLALHTMRCCVREE